MNKLFRICRSLFFKNCIYPTYNNILDIWVLFLYIIVDNGNIIQKTKYRQKFIWELL